MAEAPEQHAIHVARGGDWLPRDEFLKAAVDAAAAAADVVVSLEGIDYLDASALQILLALHAEQKRKSRHLLLTNASPALRRWFEYAGASQHFSLA